MIFPKKRQSETPLFSGPTIRAGTIGLHVVSGLIAGGGIGYFLDAWLRTRFCFWIFLPLGFIAGCLNTYRDVQKLLREQDEQDAAKRRLRD